VTASVRIVAIVGNPRAGSRTRLTTEAVLAGIAGLAASAGRTVESTTIELADLASELFAYPSACVEIALETATSATVLVVASPTYKATYTGLLKVFLDRMPSNALDGVVAVPLMLGGAPNHLLAVDVHLRPVLLELGASTPTRGLFVQESELDHLEGIVAEWCAASRLSLSPAFTAANAAADG
jgi:FMN reductase